MNNENFKKENENKYKKTLVIKTVSEMKDTSNKFLSRPKTEFSFFIQKFKDVKNRKLQYNQKN